MRLNEICDTCSMVELGDVEEKVLITHKSKESFKDWLMNYDDSRLEDAQVVIYNTNHLSKSKVYKILLNLGFKNVFSYIGNNSNGRGRKMKTNVMLLDLKKEGYK